MSKLKCPKCSRTLHRRRRRWYERCLLVKEVYHCIRCHQRRYRTHLLPFMF